jgi:hypothetical protein
MQFSFVNKWLSFSAETKFLPSAEERRKIGAEAQPFEFLKR